MLDVTTARIEPHERVKNEDFEYAFKSLIKNSALIDRILTATEYDYVASGMVKPKSGMNIVVEALWANGTGLEWPAYQPNESATIQVSVPTAGPRHSIVQVRGALQSYDNQSRAFYNNELDSAIFHDINTKYRLVTEVVIKNGAENGATAPQTDPGYVKIAEIYLEPSTTVITTDNIRNVTAMYQNGENTEWTAEKTRTFRVGNLADFWNKLQEHKIYIEQIENEIEIINADGYVTTNRIANNAVTTLKIANNAVTAAKLGNNAVTAEKINNGAVETAKIEDGAVTSIKLADDSVETDKINDEAVTAAKLADNSVTEMKIADSSVTTVKLRDNAVTTAKINDLAVNDNKIGTRTLVDEPASTGIISVNSKTLTQWLQGIRNNLKMLLSSSASEHLVFPIGEKYIQYPNDDTPSAKSYPGTWAQWNERAEIYEFITNAQYQTLFSNVPIYWTATSTIPANEWRVWTPGGSSATGTRCILRSKIEITDESPKEMNPINWSDIEEVQPGTIIQKVARKEVPGHNWADPDLDIGDSVIIDGQNMRVVGVLTLSGTFPSFAGGNRPSFISDGVQGDAIRQLIGNFAEGHFSGNWNWGNRISDLFKNLGPTYPFSGGQGYSMSNTSFDSSRVVPTANENQPRNLSVIIWRRIN